MIPDDQIRFTTATLLAVPLAILLRYIPSYAQRRFYSITTATILQYYVYSNELWIVFLLHSLIYALIKFKGRKCGAFITIVSILILSIYHIYRMVSNYGGWELDVSTMLMLNISKYSLFAFAYQDGAVQPDKITYQHRKKDRLETLPSFLDYLGFCQFLPTGVLPTPLEYMRYNNYMHQSQQFANIPFVGSLQKAGKDLAISLACLGPYILCLFYFPMDYMKTKDFLNSGVIYVILYSFFSVSLNKFKYYFGWKYCQLSVHLSGVTYEPKKQIADQFLGIQACDPWKVQSTIHVRDKIAHWNMGVQQWLKKCVYERLPFSKDIAGLITFIVSAFWHGFYEGYYFGFVLWFMQMHVAGLVFKWSKDKSSPLMKLYQRTETITYIIIWVFWNYLFVHSALYFGILEHRICFDILAYFKYFSPIALMTLLVIFTVLGGKKKSQTKKSEVIKIKEEKSEQALLIKTD